MAMDRNRMEPMLAGSSCRHASGSDAGAFGALAGLRYGLGDAKYDQSHIIVL